VKGRVRERESYLIKRVAGALVEKVARERHLFQFPNNSFQIFISKIISIGGGGCRNRSLLTLSLSLSLSLSLRE